MATKPLDRRNILVSKQSVSVPQRIVTTMTDAMPFLPGLSPIAGKSLTSSKDVGNLSSNGGLVVLREAARRLGLAAVIADPLPDTRNALLVIHSYRAMATARMMAIAAGALGPNALAPLAVGKRFIFN